MDPSILVGVLRDLGVNVSASAIYDFLKEKFGSQSSVKKTVLENEFSVFLKIHGVKAEAATVIKVLADSGFLSIKGSEFIARDGILIGAGEGARFSFGENGASKTAKTAIHANGNVRVEGSNAAVKLTDWEGVTPSKLVLDIAPLRIIDYVRLPLWHSDEGIRTAAWIAYASLLISTVLLIVSLLQFLA